MSKESSSRASSGIGFTGLLTIVFIVLKLLNVIQWSWLWVLSPIWISIALAIFILVVALLIAILRRIYKNKKKNRKLYRKL